VLDSIGEDIGLTFAVFLGVLLRELEIRCTFLDAHLFGLIATHHYATVIIREHHAWNSL
jgi:hypothetical protein